jgi:hypothetical protein
MSGQLESHHFFRVGDLVHALDGRTGVVLEAWTHYAAIRWSDGRREELDQFDPGVTVVRRAEEG